MIKEEEFATNPNNKRIQMEAECAYILFVIAIFWITEALPLSITALLPGLMFPMFGIMTSTHGGFCLFQRLSPSVNWSHLFSNINRKMEFAQEDCSEDGDDGGGKSSLRLTLGFMSSTAFLSMWLSNTSTAAMVMPIVEAVAQQIISAEAEAEATQMTYFNESAAHGLELDETVIGQETNEINEKTKPATGNTVTGAKYRSKKDHMLCKLMCLCIAYSSTIGGLTTLTGTSTNLIFSEHFNTNATPIVAASTLDPGFCFPSLLLLFFYFCHGFGSNGFSWDSIFKEMFKCGKTKTLKEKACAEVIKQEYEKLGPMRYQEIVTLVIFVVMALLWFSRDPGFVTGWSVLFSEYSGFVTDSTVALVAGILFFLIPAKKLTKTTSTGEIIAFDYSPLITWKEFQSFHALGHSHSCWWRLCPGRWLSEYVSGLSGWIGSKLSPLGSLPVWLIILISSLIVTSLTEVASNPATITILFPILTPLAEAIHVNPLQILLPSTLCTSFAFLLPVANPPNAIVFSYGHLRVIDMVKAGLGVNILGVAVVMLGMFTWIEPMFNLQEYPAWAPDLGNQTIP
ncbi:Solute carrier family 13 member 1 [Apodemus speciosus]|uniref:Solute carrier family 13 member 1 n=1 Tax=Apodemus speciosus TaxID=105296 RepID=A0ABQ0EU87_APOSI